jgi:hypothetical protein
MIQNISYDNPNGDVCGSVHYSITHTKIANKMQQCINIYYSMFI